MPDPKNGSADWRCLVRLEDLWKSHLQDQSLPRPDLVEFIRQQKPDSSTVESLFVVSFCRQQELLPGSTEADWLDVPVTLKLQYPTEYAKAIEKLRRILGVSTEDGATFAGHKIVKHLKNGGMGSVFHALHPCLGNVALKILRVDQLQSVTHTTAERKKQYLFQEARILRHLSHKYPGYFPQCHDAGTDHGVHYITETLVEGRTLKELISADDITLEDVLHIGEQSAYALACAWKHGVQHRDVSPSNLMYARDGQVTIVDFGIASDNARSDDTAPGPFHWTPGYEAPEVRNGGYYDQSSEMYSLAAVLWEVCTGHRYSEFGKVSYFQLRNDLTCGIGDNRDDLNQIRSDLRDTLQHALKDWDRKPSTLEDFRVLLSGLLQRCRAIDWSPPSLVRMLNKTQSTWTLSEQSDLATDSHFESTLSGMTSCVAQTAAIISYCLPDCSTEPSFVLRAKETARWYAAVSASNSLTQVFDEIARRRRVRKFVLTEQLLGVNAAVRSALENDWRITAPAAFSEVQSMHAQKMQILDEARGILLEKMDELARTHGLTAAATMWLSNRIFAYWVHGAGRSTRDDDDDNVGVAELSPSVCLFADSIYDTDQLLMDLSWIMFGIGDSIIATTTRQPDYAKFVKRLNSEFRGHCLSVVDLYGEDWSRIVKVDLEQFRYDSNFRPPLLLFRVAGSEELMTANEHVDQWGWTAKTKHSSEAKVEPNSADLYLSCGGTRALRGRPTFHGNGPGTGCVLTIERSNESHCLPAIDFRSTKGNGPSSPIVGN